MNEERITASEGIYGFAGWLTMRREAVIMGAEYDSAIVASLVLEWLVENGYGKLYSTLQRRGVKWVTAKNMAGIDDKQCQKNAFRLVSLILSLSLVDLKL